jgi:hypothetical protein
LQATTAATRQLHAAFGAPGEELTQLPSEFDSFEASTLNRKRSHDDVPTGFSPEHKSAKSTARMTRKSSARDPSPTRQPAASSSSSKEKKTITIPPPPKANSRKARAKKLDPPNDSEGEEGHRTMTASMKKTRFGDSA